MKQSEWVMPIGSWKCGTYRGVTLFVGTIFLSFFPSGTALPSCVSDGAAFEVEATGAKGEDRNDLAGFEDSSGPPVECSRDIRSLGVVPLSRLGDLDVWVGGSGVGRETVSKGTSVCCGSDLTGVAGASRPSSGASR